MPNALPFYWAGYRLEVQYTYRLAGLGEEALWDGLRGSIRREIRKARRRVEVREDLGLDLFHAVWAKTFARQGLAPPVSLAELERAGRGVRREGARAMLFACDEAGRVHAVAYPVWDRHAAFNLLGGADPDLRTSGASSLLMWESDRRARGVTDVFDFEGSMLRPVERFFRAFGSRQTLICGSVARAGRPGRPSPARERPAPARAPTAAVTSALLAGARGSPPRDLVLVLLHLDRRKQLVLGVRQRLDVVLLRVALDVRGGPLVLADRPDVVPVGIALEGGNTLAGLQQSQHQVGELAHAVRQAGQRALVVHVGAHADLIAQRRLLDVVAYQAAVGLDDAEVDLHSLAAHGDRQSRLLLLVVGDQRAIVERREHVPVDDEKVPSRSGTVASAPRCRAARSPREGYADLRRDVGVGQVDEG